jgi:hypothetical protein
MEIKTINPILVNPSDTSFNGYSLTNTNNLDLEGQEQDINSGQIVVKGVNPVFEGDREITRNEFLFAEPVEFENETLTPMDEYLWSNLTSEERKAKRGQRKVNRDVRRKEARDKANQTTPGNGEPTKEEQEAKIKEGKFWDVLKGSWQSFSQSPSGMIVLDSATNYVVNKLGGSSFTPPPGGENVTDGPKNEDENKPMSKTTKILLIGGGVVVLGLIIYAFTKVKK